MESTKYEDAGRRASIQKVRGALFNDESLMVAELAVDSGVMLATRRFKEVEPEGARA
jgi:hypothetical protein